MSTQNPSAKTTWLIVLGLLGLSCVYLPGLGGPFLLDDFANVTVVTPATWSGEELTDVALRNTTGLLRRPVSNLSFAANYLLGGPESWHYKATNLGLHVLCAILLFALLRRLLEFLGSGRTRATWIAAAGAAIWLIHPLQVSTVLYVVQRMAMLSALFTLAGLLLYCQWRVRIIRDAPDRSAFFATGYFICLVLAVLSKENGALLPLLTLLLEHWCFRWRTGSNNQRRFRRYVALMIALPLIVGAIGALLMLERFFGRYEFRDFTMAERLATQGPALVFYLRLIVTANLFRMGLYHDDFRVFSPTEPGALLAWGLIAVLILLAFVLRRRAPLIGCGIAFFFGAHALESSFIGLELVWEHRNYLAMAGVVMVLTGGLLALRVRVVAPLLGGVILLLAGATFLRADGWSSRAEFAALQVRNHPYSPRAHIDHLQLDLSRASVQQGLNRIAFLRHELPDEAWPGLLYLFASCVHPVAGAQEAAAAALSLATHERDYLPAFRQIVTRIIRDECAGISATEMESLIEHAQTTARMRHPEQVRQRLLILRSRLARHRGHEERSESLLREAAGVNPRSALPLLELGYMQLNGGRYDAAHETVGELRAAEANYHRPVRYLVDELERNIELARQSGKPST